MTADARWSLLTRLLQGFLDSARESQVVILENGDAVDEYIQFKRNHTILYGEVGSREWDVADKRRPLDAAARERLAGLGFTHGGPERNYVCDDLAQSAPYLADRFLRLQGGTTLGRARTMICSTPWRLCRSLDKPFR